jgi:cell division protein FtsI (penicillin-binding protein 3)
VRPHFSAARAALVLFALLVGFALLLGRVIYLQTYGRRQTLAKAMRQQHNTVPLPARRGSIYDRNGIEMAGTVQQQVVFVDPKFMQEVYSQDGKSFVDMDRAVASLAHLVDKDAFALSRMLGDRANSRFIKVADEVDEQTAAAIEKLDLPGAGLLPVNVRYYPMGPIAAHVLGGTGRDGRGLEGLELKFESLLAGHDGFKRTLKDARHRPVSVAAEDFLPAQHGQHLILTIDANIQMIAEQELKKSCEDFHAKGGEVVIMDPRTGEVLALANWPTFHPQNLGDSEAKVRLNRCLAAPYEPGSTIKPFVVGPALAQRVTRVGEVWEMPASYQSELRKKPVTDVHHYAQLCTWDVLVKSSNIGMTMLGERLGKGRLREAIYGFGFGRPTGIELPAEDPGMLIPASKMGNADVVSMVQGYAIMVTPVQMARAFCAYANGGRIVQPSVVKGVLDADGRVVSRVQPPNVELMPAAVDPFTAAEMKRILCDTLVRGTAKKARSRTWNIFGKTGTSHISGGKGGYDMSRYNSSFVAGAPFEEPRVVVAFVIHEPDRKLAHYGGDVAAPGAGRLIDRVLTYLQVQPSPELQPPPPPLAAKLYNFNPKEYRWPAEPAGTAVTASDTADVGE